MQATVKVYGQRVFSFGRCSGGTDSLLIEAERVPEYVGNAAGAADYLEARGVDGRGVEIRYPGGIRSCMNKPSLWEDLRAMAAA